MFSAGWSMTDLNDGLVNFFFSLLVGIYYLNAYFSSSHPFLFVYRTKMVVPIDVMLPSQQRSYASKLSNLMIEFFLHLDYLMQAYYLIS